MDRAKLEALEKLLADVASLPWRRSHFPGDSVDDASGDLIADFIGDEAAAALAAAAVNALPDLLRVMRAVADAPKGEVWQHTMLGGQRQTHVVITREAGDGLASMGPVILLRADAADTTAGEG